MRDIRADARLACDHLGGRATLPTLWAAALRALLWSAPAPLRPLWTAARLRRAPSGAALSGPPGPCRRRAAAGRNPGRRFGPLPGRPGTTLALYRLDPGDRPGISRSQWDGAERGLRARASEQRGRRLSARQRPRPVRPFDGGKSAIRRPRRRAAPPDRDRSGPPAGDRRAAARGATGGPAQGTAAAAAPAARRLRAQGARRHHPDRYAEHLSP